MGVVCLFVCLLFNCYSHLFKIMCKNWFDHNERKDEQEVLLSLDSTTSTTTTSSFQLKTILCENNPILAKQLLIRYHELCDMFDTRSILLSQLLDQVKDTDTKHIVAHCIVDDIDIMIPFSTEHYQDQQEFPLSSNFHFPVQDMKRMSIELVQKVDQKLEKIDRTSDLKPFLYALLETDHWSSQDWTWLQQESHDENAILMIRDLQDNEKNRSMICCIGLYPQVRVLSANSHEA